MASPGTIDDNGEVTLQHKRHQSANPPPTNATARSPFYYRCHLWTNLMTLVQIVRIDLGKNPFVRDDDEAHDDEVEIST